MYCRVTTPLMVTIDFLLSNAIFDRYLDLSLYSSVGALALYSFHSLHRQSFPNDLLALVKDEVVSSADTKKLLASINVYVSHSQD